MKNRLYSIAIYAVFLIPFVAPWEGGHQTTGGFATKGIDFNQATPQLGGVASFLPVLDWDLSDLDARDAQNQPVAELNQDLSALFTGSLFNLAVVHDLHLMNEVWKDVTAFSTLFNKLFFDLVYPLWQAIPKVCLPATKRFVHNVYNVWITVLLVTLLAAVLLRNVFENSSAQKLILRC